MTALDYASQIPLSRSIERGQRQRQQRPRLVWLLSFSASLQSATGECGVGTKRVACVGASITWGLRSSWGHSYPDQLQSLLGPTYCVMNFGRSSTTMLQEGDFPYWGTPQFTQALISASDYVFIMLGSNDAKPRNWIPHGWRFEQDYLQMIQGFRENGHQNVFALTTPPLYAGGATSYINGTIVNQRLPRIITQIAQESHAGLVDVWSTFWAHCPNSATGCEWMTDDGLHPNDAGYWQIANLVRQAIVGPGLIGVSVLPDSIEPKPPALDGIGNHVVPAVMLIGMFAFSIAAAWRARCRLLAPAVVENHLSSEYQKVEAGSRVVEPVLSAE